MFDDTGLNIKKRCSDIHEEKSKTDVEMTTVFQCQKISKGGKF